MNILLRLRQSLIHPRHPGHERDAPEQHTASVAWAERRSAPEACAQCHEQTSEYVFMDDQAHYCVDCAVMLVLTRKAYPAGRRAEDFAIEQLVRDRLRWAVRMRANRAAFFEEGERAYRPA